MYVSQALQSVPGARTALHSGGRVTAASYCAPPVMVTHRIGVCHRPPTVYGKTVILTITDRFSKAAHFIALHKLPSDSEATKIVNHVFRLHGIPTEIVSERGPQFISQTWITFCSSLGAKVCLSSGYHPQNNGETKWLNQEVEAALHCISTLIPVTDC